MDSERNQKKSMLFGYYISVITTVLTFITFAIAYATPPLSGPFCKANCFQYPYADIASRFPRDYYWMYFAIILSVLYLIMMVTIHYAAKPEKKLFSHISVLFALFSTMILTTDYFIQVSVIQPSLLSGESEGIAILSQFNPHGIFIVLEEIGFLSMVLSFFFLFPVFNQKNRLERTIRWTTGTGLALTISALVLFSLIYGIKREYRFEVAVISIAWLELIVLGILFSRYFKKSLK